MSKTMMERGLETLDSINRIGAWMDSHPKTMLAINAGTFLIPATPALRLAYAGYKGYNTFRAGTVATTAAEAAIGVATKDAPAVTSAGVAAKDAVVSTFKGMGVTSKSLVVVPPLAYAAEVVGDTSGATEYVAEKATEQVTKEMLGTTPGELLNTLNMPKPALFADMPDDFCEKATVNYNFKLTRPDIFSATVVSYKDSKGKDYSGADVSSEYISKCPHARSDFVKAYTEHLTAEYEKSSDASHSRER